MEGRREACMEREDRRKKVKKEKQMEEWKEICKDKRKEGETDRTKEGLKGR